MNERLKELRRVLNFSQEELGTRLGVTRAAISRLENGERNITEQMALSIIREFNVNEVWLRTGIGEMFEEISRDEELAGWAGRLLVGNSEEDEFIKKFVHTLSKLDSRDWEALRKIATAMSEQNKKEYKQKELD